MLPLQSRSLEGEGSVGSLGIAAPLSQDWPCPQTPSFLTLERPSAVLSGSSCRPFWSCHVRGSAVCLRCHKAPLRPRFPPRSMKRAYSVLSLSRPQLFSQLHLVETLPLVIFQRGRRTPSLPRVLCCGGSQAHRPVSWSTWLTRPLALQVWPRRAQGHCLVPGPWTQSSSGLASWLPAVLTATTRIIILISKYRKSPKCQ